MTKVYGNYTSEEMDLQYDIASVVEQAMEKLQQHDKDSALLIEKYESHLSIPYGDTDGQKLDVFPCAGEKSPIHVFIHGGYWRSHDKSRYRVVAPTFVDRGAVAVLPNYDLCPKVTLADIVEQNRRALQWVWENADRIGGDRDKIYVSGHSAGGHLVAMMMATDWESRGVRTDVIKGGCAISGLFDMEPMRHTFLNEDLKIDDQVVRDLSPIYHLPKQSSELIIAVGGGETDEFVRHSKEFTKMWLDAGLPGEYLEVPNEDHVDVVGGLADPESMLAQRVFKQMGI